MTAYNAPAVADAVIAYQKPITLQQGRALRDNPKAMGEADASVPSNLLPSVLLGTLTTTSGTTQTLSSLVLTPYKYLRISLNKVSFTASSTFITLASQQVTAAMVTAGGAGQFSGEIMINLSTGIATSMTVEGVGGGSGSQLGAVYMAVTGYSTATTSIVFAGGTFDGGSILVYGEK